jgi:environmental stress-induced protein Ves
MIHVVSAASHRVMPWKNGGGTTTEIHIQPPGAGWEDFDWRVGIADIRRSGPFSSFPGIERSIMLLDCPAGSAMRLTIDGRDVPLSLHRFVEFPGEAATHGVLTGEPVRDFNVMSRRGRVTHRARHAHLVAGGPLDLPAASWNFAFVAAGRARVVVPSGDESTLLDTTDSALVEGEAMRIEAMTANCDVVLAAFDAIPREPAIASRSGPADTRR